MRLIGLLIVVLAVGLLTARQLTGPQRADQTTLAHQCTMSCRTGPQRADQTAVPATDDRDIPRAPQRAQDVPEFEREMRRFTDEVHAEQKQRIEDTTRR
jgi:hypothetical protein